MKSDTKQKPAPYRKIYLMSPAVSKFDEPIPAANESVFGKFKERVQRYRSHGKDRHHFVFGVFDRISGNYVGQIDLFMINRQLLWGNIGYQVQNQYCGKGYATEGARLVLLAAFELLGFHRIEAAMELGNKASRKVAAKIGLKSEGKRKKNFPDNGGIDMTVYATNAIDTLSGKRARRAQRRRALR